VITAKREDFGGYRYTSTRMKTQGPRASSRSHRGAHRAAAKQGTWPAFWMLGANIGQVGWPASGEIDIMEQINTGADVYGTVHWQGTTAAREYGGHIATSPTNYHVYAIEWDTNAIKWFIDGQQFHVIDITNGTGGTEEFQRDFFMLLNMAVGGNWPGFNIDEGALPARMYVDYVRVYQRGTRSRSRPRVDQQQHLRQRDPSREQPRPHRSGVPVSPGRRRQLAHGRRPRRRRRVVRVEELPRQVPAPSQRRGVARRNDGSALFKADATFNQRAAWPTAARPRSSRGTSPAATCAIATRCCTSSRWATTWAATTRPSGARRS
jgi:hypothetical protein